MKKIVLYGAGGFGREVANMIEIMNLIKPQYELIGFLVDKQYYKKDTFINGYPLLGDEEWLYNKKDIYCNCTIADSISRERIQGRLVQQGIRFLSLIAPDVYIPKSTMIGDGCIICGRSLISVNVTIEEGVFLNSCVTIGHDVIIKKYASVMPGVGISGSCIIGERARIGGHAFIIPGKKVGSDAVVAAGSICFNNVKQNTTVLGNPAKRMRAIENF